MRWIAFLLCYFVPSLAIAQWSNGALQSTNCHEHDEWWNLPGNLDTPWNVWNDPDATAERCPVLNHAELRNLMWQCPCVGGLDRCQTPNCMDPVLCYDGLQEFDDCYECGVGLGEHCDSGQLCNSYMSIFGWNFEKPEAECFEWWEERNNWVWTDWHIETQYGEAIPDNCRIKNVRAVIYIGEWCHGYGNFYPQLGYEYYYMETPPEETYGNISMALRWGAWNPQVNGSNRYIWEIMFRNAEYEGDGLHGIKIRYKYDLACEEGPPEPPVPVPPKPVYPTRTNLTRTNFN